MFLLFKISRLTSLLLFAAPVSPDFFPTRIPPAHRPWATRNSPLHNSPTPVTSQFYGNQQFSENIISFSRILAYFVAPRQIIDFKNVNPFSPLFPKILLFITSVQNLCSFFYYVNHINPHTFLWRMWITLRITSFLQGFVDFCVWITLRMECGKCWFFRQALCIFYNWEYSENNPGKILLFSSIFSLRRHPLVPNIIM